MTFIDLTIRFLGSIVGLGLVFIVLFAIVEFIPPLKLFPRAKYLTPFLLGTLFLLPFLTSSHGLSGLLAGVIAVALAFWYACGGIRSGCRRLKALEKNADQPVQERTSNERAA